MATDAAEPTAAPGPVSRSPAFVAITLVITAALVALQLGWVPALRYAWAYNFWQYLPSACTPVLAAMSFALCVPRVRDALIAAAGRLADRVASLPRPALEAISFAALLAFFSTVRERQFFGDSYILLSATDAGWVYVFPELGATTFTYVTAKLVEPLGIGLIPLAQANSCLFGTATAILLTRAFGTLEGVSGRRAVALTALVLSSGLLRIFAGHVEVYPPFLAAASGYLWAAFAFLRGRASLVAPALALGVAIWVHAAGLFLVPSLALLPRLVDTEMRLGAWLARAARAVALAAVPSLGFLVAMAAFGPAEDFQRFVDKIFEVAGLSAAPEATSWWVRFSEAEPPAKLGIDYVFLSFAHVKYLINAYHLLSAAAVAMVGATLLFARSRLLDPIALFLVTGAAPLVAYSTLLRPFWGPFDWDLFAGAPFVLAALAGHLATRLPSPRDFAHVVLLMVGLQLLHLGGPFAAMAAGPTRDAGPFVRGGFYSEIGKKGERPHGRIAPWL